MEPTWGPRVGMGAHNLPAGCSCLGKVGRGGIFLTLTKHLLGFGCPSSTERRVLKTPSWLLDPTLPWKGPGRGVTQASHCAWQVGEKHSPRLKPDTVCTCGLVELCSKGLLNVTYHPPRASFLVSLWFKHLAHIKPDGKKTNVLEFRNPKPHSASNIWWMGWSSIC